MVEGTPPLPLLLPRSLMAVQNQIPGLDSLFCSELKPALWYLLRDAVLCSRLLVFLHCLSTEAVSFSHISPEAEQSTAGHLVAERSLMFSERSLSLLPCRDNL